MKVVWMSMASHATPWPLSRKRDSWIFSEIWRFSFRKRRLWAIGTCLGLLPRSVRVWMLEAGLPDTALINSYNSFWLALLAKRIRKQPHGQYVYLDCLSWYVFPKCVGSVATKPFSATYPSLFAMASPSSPAIVDVTCDCIFVSFIIRIKFVFWCRSSESRYKRHRNSLQNYEKGWKLANYAC